MQFECYSNWSQLPESVDELFESASNKSMFFTREWFETLYEITIEENQSLILATVADENHVLALLPLIISTNSQPLETHSQKNFQSFSHRYTALFSLLLVEENQIQVLNCLATGLHKQQIYSLQLSPAAEDDSNLLNLQKALEPLGYKSHQHFFFYNWVHQTKDQYFDEYLAERPAQLRNTIKRKQRKLEREHQHEIRLFKGDAVQEALKDYHSAYSSSWKAHEQYPVLLDSLAVNFSKRDWTRLAVLYIDGEAAAAQLWFVVKNKANIFRLAYDEKWKAYSPGSILTAYLMRYVIDTDKVEEIDFLTGNEKYKQDWMTIRRQRFRLSLYKPQQTHPETFTSKLKRIINRLPSIR